MCRVDFLFTLLLPFPSCRSKAFTKAQHNQPRNNDDVTIVPWSLPHTGAIHNQWQGLYGRINCCE
jgi:hypothetical protein